MLKGEIADVKEQAESHAAEIRRLQATVETYKMSNEELNVCSSQHRNRYLELMLR